MKEKLKGGRGYGVRTKTNAHVVGIQRKQPARNDSKPFVSRKSDACKVPPLTRERFLCCHLCSFFADARRFLPNSFMHAHLLMFVSTRFQALPGVSRDFPEVPPTLSSILVSILRPFDPSSVSSRCTGQPQVCNGARASRLP